MTRVAPSGGADTWRRLSLVVSDAAVLFGQLQALLESIGAGLAPPKVCFERWSSPALILGTGQRSGDADLAACRTRGIPVVRRLAGGTAVHATADYLSFTVVAPAAQPLVGGDLRATYRRLGEVVVAACRALGVPGHLVRPDEARARPTPVALRPCCYGGISPYEVLVGARKLIGVAQVRRFGAVAYVGGLYRAFDPAEQSACLAGEVALRAERATQLAAVMTDLAAVGRPDALDRFPAALTTALAECQGIIPTPGEFTDAERARAARLTAEQYARDEWTLRM